MLKPQGDEGLIMYSGHHEIGDFISLSLNMGYVDFTFDLGSGPATVRLYLATKFQLIFLTLFLHFRSEFQLSMNQWHTIRVSRTSRLAVLKVNRNI